MSMAKLNPILTLLIVLCSSSLTSNSKLPNPKTGGLLLRMTHIDSPDSPMYQPELTEVDRAKRLLGISSSMMRYGDNSTTQEHVSRYHETDLMPEIKKQGMLYYVEIGVGQFNDVDLPFHRNFLAFDTGSDDVWTQCEKCRICFHQSVSLFPKSRSQTYRPFPCKQCPGDQCSEDHCTVSIGYVGGTTMRGIWAREAFSFMYPSLRHETVNDVKFACAMETTNFATATYRYNIITGILGMSKSKNSLISQLGARAGYQFSYCLQDRSNRVVFSPMFLSFGTHIMRPQNMSVTPILGRRSFYYVGLNDISVNGKRLNIPQHYLALKRDYSGGTIFDAGATTSRIVSGAFDILKDAVANYVTDQNIYLQRYLNPNEYNLEACWEPLYDSPSVNFPNITFHFRNNANMLVQPTEVISSFSARGIRRPGLYCMPIYRSPGDRNVIGATQQINQRVITNIQTSEISFAATDCSRSTW